MQFTSLIFAGLLAPTAILANGCTHLRVRYQIEGAARKAIQNQTSFRPESNRYPHTAGKVEDYNKFFDANESNFRGWINTPSTGGNCGGGCARPAARTGNTWEMTCTATRLNKKAAGIPGAVYGTVIASIERPCDVNCSPNTNYPLDQRCKFKVRVDLFERIRYCLVCADHVLTLVFLVWRLQVSLNELHLMGKI